MSDEELLEMAESAINTATQEGTTPQTRAAATQRSISYSLLVIARNSVPTIEQAQITSDDLLGRKDPLDKVDAILANPQAATPKDHFIAQRLKSYDKYWDAAKMRYLIDDDWHPTKDELLKDIENSWEFEHGN